MSPPIAGAPAATASRTCDFYMAFNLFRLAGIVHGIKGRMVRGTAASAHARERAETLPTLARLAREAMEACG